MRAAESVPVPPPAAPPDRLARIAPAAFALLTFAVHAACGGRYGVFRDELYFIVCGERLQAGYVDQPPGIPLVARLAHAIFGSWVPGLRLFPWLAAAATVWVVGRLAVRLGGGGRGALLASAAAFGCPILLGLGHLLTMNAFEPLLVAAAALVLVRLAQGEDPRLWIAAGGLAGLAVLFKYTAALVLIALLAGLVLGPSRRALASRWVLAGAAVAIAAVLPNLVWQAAHGFPFLELVARGQAVKNAPLSTAGFLSELLAEVGALKIVLALGGLGWLLLARRARASLFLGVGAALYLALLLASHGKPYYFATALPLLLGAGGAAWAGWLRRPVAINVAAALLALSVVLPLPFAIPIVPEETFVRIQARAGVKPTQLERDRPGALPQVYADMHGWQALADAVGRAVATLTPEERARALVFGQNYGQAAAVDVLGNGLPPAISGQNQYWLWGVPPGRGDPLIVIGYADDDEDCGGVYRERERFTTLPHDPWIRPFEDQRTIWICRGLTRPDAVEALWPRLKDYQ